MSLQYVRMSENCGKTGIRDWYVRNVKLCLLSVLVVLLLAMYSIFRIIVGIALSLSLHTPTSVFAMVVTLHGSQQTRSPLVNWFLIENRIPFVQQPPRPSNHPFGQVPFLTDEGGVEVFESGAILLYLADAYGGLTTPQLRAKYTKWVVFANSELENVCFGHRMSGPTVDKPGKVADSLEKILSTTDYLVDNTFSLADVAVASYLNYIPVFFRVNLTSRPNIVKYMARCASRPAFREAFGNEHADSILTQSKSWLGESTKKGLW